MVNSIVAGSRATFLDKAKVISYFAADTKDKCVQGYMQYTEEYFSEMSRVGRRYLYQNAYLKLFQGFILQGANYVSGTRGELTNTFSNHFGNLVTHAVNMVTQQKLAYEPQTTVTDSSALDQVKLAKGLLYAAANDPEIDLDGKLRNATQICYTLADSYVSVLWNKNLGRVVAKIPNEQTGEVVELHEGDNEYDTWTPYDVIVDTTLQSFGQRKWLILRKWENKYDLAALYPDQATEIESRTPGMFMRDTTQLSYVKGMETALVPVYHAIHKRTPAVPKGRYTIYLDENIILEDGPNKYRNGEIPVFRMAAMELWGAPYGYTRAFDLLPLQETIDRLCSTILTNQTTFGVQNIAVAKGSNPQWESLYGGLNVIEWDPNTGAGAAAIPTALQLTSTPAEIFTFLNSLIQQMGTLAGINEVTRGNPDLALKGQVSGAALALMNSTSIQFNSDLQKAYVVTAERVGTQTVHNVQDFGFPTDDWKRQGVSQASNRQYFKKEYGKTDLDKVDKIVVRYGNPLAQTTSGRLQIAETLLQNKLVDAQQYLAVIETGNLEELTQAASSQLQLIKEENEAMSSGQTPLVLILDNHALHISEHTAPLASLETRNNPVAVKAFLAHISEHQQMMKQQKEGGGPIPMPAAPAPVGPPVANAAPVAPTVPVPNGAGLPQAAPLPTAPGAV